MIRCSLNYLESGTALDLTFRCLFRSIIEHIINFISCSIYKPTLDRYFSLLQQSKVLPRLLGLLPGF